MVKRIPLEVKVQLNAQCCKCGAKEEHKVTLEEFKLWRNGASIQSAFPELDANQRELLLNGVCGACFDEMFDENLPEPKPTFYLSFGQKYFHQLHETGAAINPNQLVVFKAENEDEARVMAMEYFGKYWSHLYTEENVDFAHFPSGLLKLDDVQYPERKITFK